MSEGISVGERIGERAVVSAGHATGQVIIHRAGVAFLILLTKHATSGVVGESDNAVSRLAWSSTGVIGILLGALSRSKLTHSGSLAFPNCIRIPGCNWERQWHTKTKTAQHQKALAERIWLFKSATASGSKWSKRCVNQTRKIQSKLAFVAQPRLRPGLRQSPPTPATPTLSLKASSLKARLNCVSCWSATARQRLVAH